MDNLTFSRMAEKYLNTVYRVALNSVHNADDAEDIVQNTFCKLLMSRDHFKDEEHIRKWLIRVAINEAHYLFRTPWKKHVDYLEDIEKQPEIWSEDDKDLYYAVNKLPVKYRQVLYLFYYEEYSTREIAQILEISENSVRTRLLRARKKLKSNLKEDWR